MYIYIALTENTGVTNGQVNNLLWCNFRRVILDNDLLTNNIFRLSRKLKIKITDEIRGLDYYEALQLEVKSLKASNANSPNLVEIGAIFISTIAFMVSIIAFYGSFATDTSYYFSETEAGDKPVEMGFATYLIKNAPDKSILNFNATFTAFGLISVLAVSWLLIRQIRLNRSIKELEILDYYLGTYINKQKYEDN